MSSSPTTAATWEQFFRSVAHHLKALAAKQWPLEADGSGSDVYVSMHRLFNAFPLPVDVLLLDTSGINSPVKEGNLAALIRYDFTRPNTLLVREHGVIPLADLRSHVELVGSLVELEEWNYEDVRELRLRGTYRFPHFVDIVPFDPRTDPTRYALEMLIHFDPHGEFLELFSVHRDFNTEYHLKADSVLEEADLLRISPVNVGFFSRDRATATREIQEAVAGIQLIPQVPEHPRRVFEWAKRLYIFGLFEYGFFTVSCHYAYLAIESAVYNRWNAAQPSPTILQHGANSISVPSAGRNNIGLICKEKGWKENAVKVNGKPYPLKVGMAIDQLRQGGAINAWQHRRLRDVWMKGRNIHSHLEFASITGPRLGTLERAAEVINILFDSVKP
jgi:hypothetical protein